MFYYRYKNDKVRGIFIKEQARKKVCKSFKSLLTEGCQGGTEVRCQPDIEKSQLVIRIKKQYSRLRLVNVSRLVPKNILKRSQLEYQTLVKVSWVLPRAHVRGKVLKIPLKWSHPSKRLKGLNPLGEKVQKVLGSEETTRIITMKHLGFFLEQEKEHVMSKQVLLSQGRKEISYLEGGRILRLVMSYEGPIWGTAKRVKTLQHVAP